MNRTLSACGSNYADGSGRLIAFSLFAARPEYDLNTRQISCSGRPKSVTVQIPLLKVYAEKEMQPGGNSNGKVDIQEFDDAGRLIMTIENYQP